MSETALTTDPTRPAPPARKGSIARATEGQFTRLERMARSGLTTLAAAVGELAEFAVAGAIVDFVIAGQLGRNPYIDHGFSLTTLVGALALVGYALVAVELIARRRVPPRRRFVLPLIFLPLGRAVRGLLLLALCLVVLVPKLAVYFLALTVGVPVLGLLRLLGAHWATRLLDNFDIVFEHLETVVNHIYNALFYNPIEARGSAFGALFNLPLTLWCLNH